MGEGNLQQLIIVGFFLLFGLLDLIGRALKKRGGGQTVESDRREYQRDEDDFDVFEQPAPTPVSMPRTVQSAPRTAPTREAPERASAPRVAPLRGAPLRAPSARKASAGMTALDRLDTGSRGRGRDGAPLLNVDDARRAILAMTILGPCRAIEPHSDPSSSR